MKMGKNILKILMVGSISLSMMSTVYAAKNVNGGVWSYGGHHDPSNWGAFSNYYHKSKNHWSSVTRHSDSVNDIDHAVKGKTSMAFLNTKLGEKCDFDYGF